MRLRITLDDHLVRDLDRVVGARERSSFIARAVRRAIDELDRTEAVGLVTPEERVPATATWLRNEAGAA